MFYEPSKELMKKMAYYYDIPTPPWAFVYSLVRMLRAVVYSLVRMLRAV